MRIPLSVLLLPVAVAAAAAEEATGHHGGIPWFEILKQAVNFLILAGVLVYFLRKPLSAFLAERTAMLRTSIEEASRAREAAVEKLSAVEERMKRLSGEIEELNRRMDGEAGEESRRLQEAAMAEIRRVQEQVRFAADQEVRKAKQALRREASVLSAKAAEEILAKTITPEDQDRLVRENIEKLKEIAQ
ncbi:MAG: ATP synthase F0 subunit B [Deltaproteobacteria bacterium]